MCLLQTRESCRGCPPWRVAGSWWGQDWGRMARWSVHQDYDYIARMPGTVHRYRYSPRLRRYPGMWTLVAVRPRWSPPSPESEPPVLRSATWPNTPWGRGVGAWGRLVGPGVGARIRCTGAGRRRCPPSMDHQDPCPRRFHRYSRGLRRGPQLWERCISASPVRIHPSRTERYLQRSIDRPIEKRFPTASNYHLPSGTLYLCPGNRCYSDCCCFPSSSRY